MKISYSFISLGILFLCLHQSFVLAVDKEEKKKENVTFVFPEHLQHLNGKDEIFKRFSEKSSSLPVENESARNSAEMTNNSSQIENEGNLSHSGNISENLVVPTPTLNKDVNSTQSQVLQANESSSHEAMTLQERSPVLGDEKSESQLNQTTGDEAHNVSVPVQASSAELTLPEVKLDSSSENATTTPNSSLGDVGLEGFKQNVSKDDEPIILLRSKETSTVKSPSLAQYLPWIRVRKCPTWPMCGHDEISSKSHLIPRPSSSNPSLRRDKEPDLLYVPITDMNMDRKELMKRRLHYQRVSDYLKSISSRKTLAQIKEDEKRIILLQPKSALGRNPSSSAPESSFLSPVKSAFNKMFSWILRRSDGMSSSSSRSSKRSEAGLFSFPRLDLTRKFFLGA